MHDLTPEAGLLVDGLRHEELVQTGTSAAQAMRHNRGRYVLLEGALPGCAAEGACVRAFARGGISDRRLNLVATAWEAGAVWSARPDGVSVGAALARAEGGATFRWAQGPDGAPVTEGETNLELSARVPLTGWLSLQPDVQYVIDPGMDAGRRHVLAGAVRLALSF